MLTSGCRRRGRREPLTKKQIATLKAWIEQGAKWEEHWSFLPPTKPAVPTVSDKCMGTRSARRLRPRAPGTRATQARGRGDPRGVAAPRQLRPHRPAAHARGDRRVPQGHQCRRLREAGRSAACESPRYGERQAQEWLDLARYADTSGYQNDQPRSDLEVARVGRQRLQREHAVRPVRDRAARRRSAPQRDARAEESPPASTAITRPTAKQARRRTSTARPT